MLPWWVRFTPQPDSLSAGDAYHRSWKFGAAPGVPPAAQVGGVSKICRVMAFDCVIPLTVYPNVPLLASVNENVTVPTWVTPISAGLNGTALKAGPVVRKSEPE